MKKSILLVLAFVLSVIIANAQPPSVSITPVICFNPQTSNIATGVVTPTVPGATGYSWTASTSGSCVPTFTASSNGQMVSINFNCCGNYTVYCLPYGIGGIPLTSLIMSRTVSVVCPNSLTAYSSKNSVCAGDSVTLNAAGASGGYTWAPGNLAGPSVIAHPTVTTCYTVTAYNNGCFSSAVKCISVQPSSNVVMNGNFNLCAGACTTLTASGAANYTWLPGGQTGAGIVVCPSVTTCYTVFGNSSACGNGAAVRCVTVQPSSNVTINGNFNVCAGSCTTLTATGAASYTWMPGGQTGAGIVVCPSVTTCYTVFGNSSACGNGAAVRCVTVQPSSNVTINGNFNVCAGSCTTLTATGAASYTWMPGGQTGAGIVVCPSVTTCYTVFGNSSSCGNGSAVRCVTVQSGGNVQVNGPNFICSGSGATLTATGGSSYTWQPGNLTGSGIFVSPSVSTCYTVTSINTNSNCSSYSGIKCITVNPKPIITIASSGFCSGGNATLTASGALSYSWFPSMQTGPNIVISPTANPCYTVVGTNSVGCSNAAVACFSTTSPNPVITVAASNNAICAGNTVTLTATGGVSYNWQPGGLSGSQIVVSPSVNTCYTVTGYSPSGCAGVAAICVSVQPSSNVAINGNFNVCAGGCTTLTATGAASYTWLPGGQTGAAIVVCPSVTTCYTVVGNSSGCGSGSAVRCVTVGLLSNIVMNGNFNVCAGNCTTLTATGATNYTWMPGGQTGPGIVVCPSVTTCYTVVGNNSGCGSAAAVRCVTVGASSNVVMNGSFNVCAGNCTTLSATGATSYTWLPGGQTGAGIVVCPSVTTCYTVIGNSQSCGAVSAVRCVTVQSPPQLGLAGSSIICKGSNANLNASGAQTYTWLPGNLTGSAIVVTPSVSTCYTVVGTAGNGCIGVNVRCITVKNKPTVTTSGGNIACSGASQTLTAGGATTYTWLPFNMSGSSIVISPTASTCYTVVGTDSTGCSNSAVNCFSVLPPPAITVSSNIATCSNNSFTLQASGANNYTWQPGGVLGSVIVVSPSVSTCYTVTGANSIGCVNKAVRCVQPAAAPSLTISGSNVLCVGNSAIFTASGANTYTWNTGATSPSIVVTPSTSGCYTVSGTNSAGCVGSAVKCFSVISSISVSISGNTSICPSGIANLVASGASSYVWNNGSTSNAIFVSPTVSTVYTVTGNIGNCSQSKTATVTVNPLPSVVAVSSSPYICAGSSATLVATGATTYTWNTGSTSPAIVVTPSFTATYTVTGTSGAGCSKSAIVTQSVANCTGLESNARNAGEIGFYPNPAGNELTLQSANSEVISYSVYDMIGRVMVKGSFSEIKTVDLSAYSNGTYIVRFESRTGTSYKKLVIEK